MRGLARDFYTEISSDGWFVTGYDGVLFRENITSDRETLFDVVQPALCDQSVGLCNSLKYGGDLLNTTTVTSGDIMRVTVTGFASANSFRDRHRPPIRCKITTGQTQNEKHFEQPVVIKAPKLTVPPFPFREP